MRRYKVKKFDGGHPLGTVLLTVVQSSCGDYPAVAGDNLLQSQLLSQYIGCGHWTKWVTLHTMLQMFKG